MNDSVASREGLNTRQSACFQIDFTQTTSPLILYKTSRGFLGILCLRLLQLSYRQYWIEV